MEIFLFILGYYVQLIASCLLLYKIYKHKSIYGLSVDTQAAYLLGVASRCVWVFETRLVDTKCQWGECVLEQLDREIEPPPHRSPVHTVRDLHSALVSSNAFSLFSVSK